MDSTFPSLPFTTRDGYTLKEDDGSLSVVAGLAKEAALLFQDRKFLDCLRVLHQILLKKPDDPQVRNNMAIAETFQDGCKDPKRLIEALKKIKKRSKELGQASGDQFEVSSINGSHPTEGVTGIDHDMHQFSSSPVHCNEFDASVAMFNIAVVWFYFHEYGRSFLYLDTLYQNIVSFDEGTALRICLLLLDVTLLSHHASRSADVISYMERVFCVNTLTSQVDNGASTQQQSLLVSKSTSLHSNSTILDTSHSDFAITSSSLENSLTRTLSEENALENEPLQLLSSLDITRHKPHNLHKPFIQAEESLSAIDSRPKLPLCKVRFFLLTRNLKAARAEIKSAMNLARTKDNTMALYLKSQLEYARGNYQKAIKLLNAPNNHMETGISSMYNNNLGCIYHGLGMLNLSGVYFAKALKENLPTFSQDKSLLITYNCGMSSLARGKPSHAFRCFEKAGLIFYNRPLLWIRIAECCLMALEKGLINSIASVSDKFDIRVNVFGKGKWRWCGILPNGQSENVGSNNFVPAKPDLSMPLARQCLINALYLLESSMEFSNSDSLPSSDESESQEIPTNHKNVKEQKGGNNQGSLLQNSVHHYKNICMKENKMMKQAALADLAYVELALENPLNALSTVRSLLKLPDCSKMYIFLGTMYVAEALCLLNRPKEAAQHLMTYVSGENEVLLPYNQNDCENWTSQKMADPDSNGGTKVPNIGKSFDEWSVFHRPEEARGIFYANFATQCALLGDFERAHYFVMRALSDIPNSSKAILTAIYVDLKRGETKEALSKLRQHSRVRFLLCSLPVTGTS